MKTLLSQKQIELAILLELREGDRTLAQLQQAIGDSPPSVCMAAIALLKGGETSHRLENHQVVYSLKKPA